MNEEKIVDGIDDLSHLLRREFILVRQHLSESNNLISKFQRFHGIIKNLAESIPDSSEKKERILKDLEDFSVQNLLKLDEEQYESIDRIEEFINSYYDKSKYDGREALGLMRGLILSGNFPPEYIIEFDRRF